VLADRGAIAAYKHLRDVERVPELGPPFFTKFLSFASKTKVSPIAEPVILDSVMARVLERAWSRQMDEVGSRHAGSTRRLWLRRRWTTYRYTVFLAFLHKVCAQLSDDGAVWTPDLVEMLLYLNEKKA
jgi:hypothetical protein